MQRVGQQGKGGRSSCGGRNPLDILSHHTEGTLKNETSYPDLFYFTAYLSDCLFVYMSVSVSVCVGGRVWHLLHEFPVGYHDLGDALQRVGLDGRVFVADHAQCNVLA
jgi:hypothetical protein